MHRSNIVAAGWLSLSVGGVGRTCRWTTRVPRPAHPFIWATIFLCIIIFIIFAVVVVVATSERSWQQWEKQLSSSKLIDWPRLQSLELRVPCVLPIYAIASRLLLHVLRSFLPILLLVALHA